MTSSSHNSTSTSSDSMSFHMTSMLHETFENSAEESADAKQYEYLLRNSYSTTTSNDDAESLPELDESTMSSRFTSMGDSPRSASVTSVPSFHKREHSVDARRAKTSSFGWTPSPIATKRRLSTGTERGNALSPYLKRETGTSSTEVLVLRRQLQQAQDEVLRVQEREQQQSQRHEAELAEYQVREQTLTHQLEERNDELVSTQANLKEMERLLELERERNAELMLQQNQPPTQEPNDNRDSHPSQNEKNGSLELYGKIDECERELQAMGVDVVEFDNDQEDTRSIPREVHTHSPSPLVTCSVDLARSLVDLLQDENISNDEEDKVWTQLAELSELLYQDHEEHDPDCTRVHDLIEERHDTTTTTTAVQSADQTATVPLEIYQELQQHVTALEQRHEQMKRSVWECMASARQANKLELEILVQEVKEEAQRQVYLIASGQQEARTIQLSHVVGEAFPTFI